MTYEQTYPSTRAGSYANSRPSRTTDMYYDDEPIVKKMTWREAVKLFIAARDKEFATFSKIMHVMSRVILAIPAVITLPVTIPTDAFDWPLDFVPGPDILSLSGQALTILGIYFFIRIAMIRRTFNKYYGF